MVKPLLGLIVTGIIILSLFSLVSPAFGMNKAIPLSETTEEIVKKAGVYSETGYYHIYVPVKSGDKYLIRYIKYDKSEVKPVERTNFASLPGEILSNVFVTSKYVYVISRAETANILYIYPRTSEPQNVPRKSKTIFLDEPYTILGIEYNGADYIIVNGGTGFKIYSYDGNELVSKFYDFKDFHTLVTVAYISDSPIVVYQVLNPQTSKHDLQYVKIKDLVTASEESNITVYKLASLDHEVIGYLQIDTDTLVTALTPTISFISLTGSGIEKEIPIPKGDTLTSAPVMEKTIKPEYVIIGSGQGKIYGVPLNNYTSLNSPSIQVSAHTTKIQYMGVINFEEATDFYVIALTYDGYIIVYRKDLVSSSSPKIYLKKRITTKNAFRGLQVFNEDNEAIITSKEQVVLIYREKELEGNPGLSIIYKIGLTPIESRNTSSSDAPSLPLPLIIGLSFVPLAGVVLYLVRRKSTSVVRPLERSLRSKPSSGGSGSGPSPSSGSSSGGAGTGIGAGGFPGGLLDRYVPLDSGPVGVGGFASVWRVRRKSDGRVVAVKVFHGGVDEDVFLREVGAWRLMRHPNIVRLYGAGVSPVPFLELEYVEGLEYDGRRVRSLRELLNAGYRFGFEDALALIRRVGDALVYAHEKRDLLHLDIKPENILLTSTFVPKLTDWGLARALSSSSHSTSVSSKAYLTLQYSAPEQLDPSMGDKGPWTDVYQLGAVAYELLAGRPPFTGSPMEIVKAILFDKPQPLHMVNPNVPQGVSEAIMRALKKDPSKRYRSVREFLQALEEALGGKENIMREMDKAAKKSTGLTKPFLLSMIRQEMIEHLKTAITEKKHEKTVELVTRLLTHYRRLLGETNQHYQKARNLHYQLQKTLETGIWDQQLVENTLQTILELEEEIRQQMIK